MLLYLVRLADKCNVNLAEAVVKKIEKNAAKYPRDLVKVIPIYLQPIIRKCVRPEARKTELGKNALGIKRKIHSVLKQGCWGSTSRSSRRDEGQG